MIVNHDKLLDFRPLDPMELDKKREHGVTYGLSEAGYDIRIKQDLWLHPLKRFSLASSIERFNMPRSLVATVHGKSTWARRGLNVMCTVIEPGWEGWLTLELNYYGWKPLHIKAGSGIAQILFHTLARPRGYDGRYQNQPNKPVEAKEAL